MLNMFAKEINPVKILKMQNLQYQEKLYLEDTVPAGSQKLGSVDISSLGNWYCLFMTGSFTTLIANDPAVDDGVQHLRAKMSDGSNNRQLFNDYIPLHHYLSPGREKSSISTGVLTDDPSGNLFYPQPWQYMFALSSQILFDVKNDSDYANDYRITFHGIRFPEAQRLAEIARRKQLRQA